MNIIEVYKKYPTQIECLKYLEKVRWNNEPKCPYCGSKNSTPAKNENRHHCNNCNTSYSVTVATIFHDTKIDLQKWFLAISLVLNAKKGLSARQLARDIEVNKNTAWYMLMRIRKAMTQDFQMLEGIVEADETYIGGKDKNKHNSNKTGGTQGRSTKEKEIVVGTLERGGKIKAKTVKDASGKSLKTFIRTNVKENSEIMTDEWRGYRGISIKYNHNIIAHNANEYVRGIVHTNTIEGFWSLLKRGIVGQYHKVSKKHLNSYMDEFCFRYNNRKNDDIFALTLKNALGV